MTSSKVNHGSHIDEGDLIRLMDGECSQPEADQIREHIDDCPDCGTALSSLQKVSDLFSTSMKELDVEVIPTRQPAPTVGKRLAISEQRFRFASPRVLRIAAVLAALVLVFTATPARALFVRGWEALKSLVISEPAESATPRDALAEPEPTVGSVVRFTPRGSEFVLEFTDRPAGGALVLLFDSTASASASVVGDELGDEMILLPSGLRIRNSRVSRASYEVRLPLSLSVVEVRVAGVQLLRIDAGAQTNQLRHELNLVGEPLTESR